MPKITINEVDSSRYVSAYEAAPMVVLVPGTASFGPTFSILSPEVNTFYGDSALSDFYALYGDMAATVDGYTLGNEMSFEYVTNLIRSGASVQFYRLNNGTKASNTISEGKSIIAKYTGSFGNKLVVKFTNKTTDSTVLNIYKSKTQYTKSEALQDKDLARMTLVYTGKVSIDEESPYFVETVDNGFIDMTKETLSSILTDESISIKNLYGALDFAGDSNTSLDKKSAETALVTACASSYESFTDPYLFDFDFVTSGGIVDDPKSGASDIHKNMIKLCQSRGDCCALLDTPKEWTYEEVSSYQQAEELNTSYQLTYAPWCSFVSGTSGKTIYFPSSLIFMKALLYGMQSQVDNELWYVPAGVSRASAPFIVSPMYEIGSTILNTFQNDLNYRVNPIMRLRNYGYCVYGNATGLNAVPGEPHSALESANVRIISNIIKKRIFDVCCGLSFEYNNTSLWLKFYSRMDETLLYMKRHYGLYDYKIVMDASTVTTKDINERRVPGKVIISPTLAGEYFDIDFEIMPSGVSFTEEE